LILGAHLQPIRIWNAETGDAINVSGPQARHFIHPLLSPDCKRVADQEAVFDVESEKQVYSLPGSALAWSSNGRHVFANRGSTILVCDADSGKTIAEFVGRHAGASTPAACECSPDSRLCASGDAYGVVWIWETATGKPRAVLLSFTDGGCVAISPEGHIRATGDVEDHIRYVALTNSGEQLTFTPAEFAERYGWKNDPEKVSQSLSRPTASVQAGDEAAANEPVSAEKSTPARP